MNACFMLMHFGRSVHIREKVDRAGSRNWTGIQDEDEDMVAYMHDIDSCLCLAQRDFCAELALVSCALHSTINNSIINNNNNNINNCNAKTN